jgi:hypothetical protein
MSFEGSVNTFVFPWIFPLYVSQQESTHQNSSTVYLVYIKISSKTGYVTCTGNSRRPKSASFCGIISTYVQKLYDHFEHRPR